MGQHEATVERHLDREFKALGGTTYKWVSPGRVGMPDRICILNGVTYYVEVKTLGGRLSSMQRRELRRLKGLGVNACVVYGSTGVDDFIKSITSGYHRIHR